MAVTSQMSSLGECMHMAWHKSHAKKACTCQAHLSSWWKPHRSTFGLHIAVISDCVWPEQASDVCHCQPSRQAQLQLCMAASQWSLHLCHDSIATYISKATIHGQLGPHACNGFSRWFYSLATGALASTMNQDTSSFRRSALLAAANTPAQTALPCFCMPCAS